MPIRFYAKNRKGKDSPIKKLHNIAYIVNAVGKKIMHDSKTADSINNWAFKKKGIADYMKTNKLTKPTLVQKSKDGSFVLKNEIPVMPILIINVPSQYRSLYIDKTQY